MDAVREFHILDNLPGPGWYWEIIDNHEIVARGLADTHAAAVAEVERAMQELERKKSC